MSSSRFTSFLLRFDLNSSIRAFSQRIRSFLASFIHSLAFQLKLNTLFRLLLPTLSLFSLQSQLCSLLYFVHFYYVSPYIFHSTFIILFYILFFLPLFRAWDAIWCRCYSSFSNAWSWRWRPWWWLFRFGLISKILKILLMHTYFKYIYVVNQCSKYIPISSDYSFRKYRTNAWIFNLL